MLNVLSRRSGINEHTCICLSYSLVSSRRNILKMEEYQYNSTTKDGQTKDRNFYNCEEERICLATANMLCIAVDKLHGNIMLRELERSDITCIFRKHVLGSKSLPNGRVETVVFALDCHRDFYLTTSSRKHLQLNFCTSSPRVDMPDERTFDVYFTKQGHVLIQPKLHFNTYLNHIDHVLSVSPLDLNERCPEEYFFHFVAIPEDPEQKNFNMKIINADIQTIENITCNTLSDIDSVKVNDIAMNKMKLMKKISGIIDMPLRKSAKSKTSWSILSFGCFKDMRKPFSESSSIDVNKNVI